MDQQFEARLATVERALTDGETDLEAVAEEAAMAERVADLEDRLGHLEDEVADLDAATQALRGYVGEVRSVNEAVEETAAAAMAKAERAQAAAEGEPRPPECEPADRDPPSAGASSDDSNQAASGAGGLQDVGSGSGTAGARRSNHQDGRGDPDHSRTPETEDDHPWWAAGASAEDQRLRAGSPSDRCPACGREDASEFQALEGPAPSHRARDEGTNSVTESAQHAADRRGPGPAHRTDSETAHWTEPGSAHRTGSQRHHEGPSSQRGPSGTARGRSDAGLLSRIRERL